MRAASAERRPNDCNEDKSRDETQLDFGADGRPPRDSDAYRRRRAGSGAAGHDSVSSADRDARQPGQGNLDARAAVDARAAGRRLAKHSAAGPADGAVARGADAPVAPAAGLRASHGYGDRAERHLRYRPSEGRLQTLHGRATAPDRIFSPGPEHSGVGRYPGGYFGQYDAENSAGARRDRGVPARSQ